MSTQRISFRQANDLRFTSVFVYKNPHPILKMDSSAANETGIAELSFQRAEFLAEDELIEINPMVRSGVIRLIRGEFGPFEPSVTSTVC